MKISSIISIVTGSEKRGQSGINVFRRSRQVFVFDQSKNNCNGFKSADIFHDVIATEV